MIQQLQSVDQIIKSSKPLVLVSVQFSCSVMSDSLWPQDCTTLGFSVDHQLPELAQTHVHRIGDAIQPSHPLSSPPPLPSVLPSNRVFSNELALFIRWPKYWRFSVSLSSEYSGMISFRIDWFDLLAVQGPLKSLFQHHSWKASSFFFSSFILLRFLFFVFFLFIALELIHSISILLMHEDCIRLKLVGICIFFPSNSKLLGCFI